MRKRTTRTLLLMRILKVLREIRDAIRDLVTLQQQQVDLYRALVNDEDDGNDWKNK